jgi:hypothetical protein
MPERVMSEAGRECRSTVFASGRLPAALGSSIEPSAPTRSWRSWTPAVSVSLVPLEALVEPRRVREHERRDLARRHIARLVQPLGERDLRIGELADAVVADAVVDRAAGP